MSRYHTFSDDTVYPKMSAVADIQDKLRYQQESLTPEDLMFAASCLSLLLNIGVSVWRRKKTLIQKFQATGEADPK